QDLVDVALRGRIDAIQRIGNQSVHRLDCPQNTFTQVAVFVAITTFYSFKFTGRGTRWNCRASQGTVGQQHFNFNGWVAARVQNFTSMNGINKGHECNLLEKSMVTVWVPYDIQSSPSVTTADQLAEILCRCGKYFCSPRAMELYWRPRLSRCFTVMLAQLCFQVDAMGTSYPDEFKELRPNIVLRHVDCQRCVLRAFAKWVLGLTSSSVHNFRGCCKRR